MESRGRAPDQGQGETPDDAKVLTFEHSKKATQFVEVDASGTRKPCDRRRTARCRCKFRHYRILQRHRAVSLSQHDFLGGVFLHTAENVRLLSKVSEDVATEIVKNVVDNHTVV